MQLKKTFQQPALLKPYLVPGGERAGCCSMPKMRIQISIASAQLISSCTAVAVAVSCFTYYLFSFAYNMT